MSGFTAEQALDAQGTEDAEMITWRRASQICHEHGACMSDFGLEYGVSYNSADDMVDAGDLLAWLGY